LLLNSRSSTIVRSSQDVKTSISEREKKEEKILLSPIKIENIDSSDDGKREFEGKRERGYKRIELIKKTNIYLERKIEDDKSSVKKSQKAVII
jgi:hypothetical protein